MLIDLRMYYHVDGRTDGWTPERTDGWEDIGTHRWTDGGMDGWADAWAVTRIDGTKTSDKAGKSRFSLQNA